MDACESIIEVKKEVIEYPCVKFEYEFEPYEDTADDIDWDEACHEEFEEFIITQVKTEEEGYYDENQDKESELVELYSREIEEEEANTIEQDADIEEEDYDPEEDYDEEEDSSSNASDATHLAKRRKMKKQGKIFEQFILRICPFCGLQFENEFDWTKHIDVEHNLDFAYRNNYKQVPGQPPQCGTCLAPMQSEKPFLLRMHFLGHQPYANYMECRLCNNKYTTLWVLRHHLRALHSREVKALDSRVNGRPQNCCLYCGKMYGSCYLVAMHYIDAHRKLDDEKIVYVCPCCGEKFVDEKLWQDHCIDIHALNDLDNLGFEIVNNESDSHYACTKCPATLKLTKSKVLLFYHASSHLPNEIGQCKFCEKKFSRISSMRSHICAAFERHVRPRLPPIDYEELAKQFRKNEPSTILYVCPSCGEEFAGKSKWNQHLNEAHSFEQLENLSLIHTSTSTDEQFVQKVKCLICERTWTEIPTLVVMMCHAFSHMPYKMRKCKVCDFQYNGYVTRLCHCKRVEKDKKNKKLNIGGIENCMLACMKCGETCKTGDELYQHVLNQHNIRTPEDLNYKVITDKKQQQHFLDNYECLTCNKIFRNAAFTPLFIHASSHDERHGRLFYCQVCNNSYNSYSGISNHVCQNAMQLKREFLFKNVLMRCPECGLEQANMNLFNKHITEEHHFDKFDNLNVETVLMQQVSQCRICKYVFPKKLLRSVRQHAYTHMPYQQYNCKMCTFGCDTKFKITEHLVDTHQIHLERKHRTKSVYLEGILFECPACKLELPNWKQYNLHLDVMHKFRTLEGLNVRKEFDEKTRHSVFYCLECDKRLSPKPARRRDHRISHLPHKPFKCRHCDMRFHQNYGIIYPHMIKCQQKFELAEERRKAKESREEAKRLKKLEVQLAKDEEKAKKRKRKPPKKKVIPKEETAEVADPLNLRAGTLNEVSKVRMMSSDDSAVLHEFAAHITFACPGCDERMSTHQDWQAHIGLEHDFFDPENMRVITAEDGKSHCLDCGVGVDKSISQQQRHRLTHLPHQSFICAICGHRSNTLYVLVGHLRRRHFTKGTFKCTMCELVFDTSFDCVMHGRTKHTLEEHPKFFCTICMLQYSTNSALRAHMYTHSENRSIYNCMVCERMYTTGTEMRKHMDDKHPDIIAIYTRNCVRCLLCTVLVRNPQELEQHLLEKHSEAERQSVGPTICPVCHYISRSTEAVDIHVKKAHRKAINECPHCKLIIPQAKAFRKHRPECRRLLAKMKTNPIKKEFKKRARERKFRGSSTGSSDEGDTDLSREKKADRKRAKAIKKGVSSEDENDEEVQYNVDLNLPPKQRPQRKRAAPIDYSLIDQDSDNEIEKKYQSKRSTSYNIVEAVVANEGDEERGDVDETSEYMVDYNDMSENDFMIPIIKIEVDTEQVLDA